MEMTNQQKKRAEELASEYAPLTWVKGIDISTSSRFGFVAGYLAAVEDCALIEIDNGVFVNPSDVSSVENNGYYEVSPSDESWRDDGSRIILKNGRKVYTKLTANQVIEKLRARKGSE